jgi:autotransporter-associated beta strand protein
MMPAVPHRVRNRLRASFAVVLAAASAGLADVVTSAPNALLVETVTIKLGGTNEFAKNNPGTTWLVPAGQTNDYSGRTTVNDGVLRGADGSGLSAASQLYLNGAAGNSRPSGVIESRGSFNRNIGAAPGEVYWNGYGGFAAHAGDLAVSLEGGAPLPWADAANGFNAKLLTFGSFTSDRTVDLQNGLALAAARSVYVYDNTNTDLDLTLFSGALSNGAASGSLLKYGDGTLVLSGANTFTGGLTIVYGAVRAVPGAGLPTNGRLILSASSAALYACVLESSGTFNWNIGTGPGEVYWAAYGGGFAAYGAPLVLNLEGGNVLNWGDAATGFNAQNLTFGSRTADNMVVLTNHLELGAARTLYTVDNPFRTTDFVRLAGQVRGNSPVFNLTLAGDGLVELAALNNSYRGNTIVNSGTLRVTGSIISNNTLTVAAPATLAGTGLVVCTNTASGVTITGALAPGVDGVGTLSVTGSLSFAAASRFDLDIGPGAAADRVEASSNLTVGASFVVALKDAGGGGCSASDQLTLMTYGRTCTAFPTNTWRLDGSAIRNLSRWDTNGATLLHDTVGKRVYLTGLTVQPRTAAETLTWNGGSGDWSDSNWTGPLASPGQTTRAVMDSAGAELAVSGARAAHTLSLSNGTVRIGGAGLLGSYYVDAWGGLLDVQGVLTNVEALTVRPPATLRVSGAVSALALDSQGAGEFLSGAALSLGTWTVSAAQQVPAGAAVTAGRVDVNADLDVGGAVSAAVMVVKAGVDAASGATLQGTVVLGDEAEVTIRGNTAEKALMVFDAGTLHAAEAASVGGLDFTLGGILDRTDASATLAVKGPLILNGRGFNADAEEADLSQALVVATNNYPLVSAGPLAVASLQVWGPQLQIVGTLTASLKLSLEDIFIGNAIAGDAQVIIGEGRLRDSLVWLAGTNSYTGKTQIERGVLRAVPGIGLPDAPGSGCLEFSGDTIGQQAVLEGNGALSRPIGTGSREVYWDNHGGFAAWGGPFEVSLEGGAMLSWSNAADGFNNKQLYLNSTSAESVVTLANPIKVDADRTVRVFDNWRTNTDMARLSGTISMDTTNRVLRKEGEGLLWLTGTNTFGGKLVIDDGVARAQPSAGLPDAAYLWFSGAVLTRPCGILESSGSFARNIGPLAGEVYWEGYGGFAAQGDPLSVTLEGGATLVWTNRFIGFNSQPLFFGSWTADQVADLRNPLSLNGHRTVYVFDNTNSSADAGKLSGVIENGISSNCALIKQGDGVLWLTGTNLFTGGITNMGGVIRAQSGAGLPAATWLTFAQASALYPCVLETEGLLNRPLGVAPNGLFWNAGAHGGFAAKGGPLEVSLQNGSPIVWSGLTNGFNGGVLHLGSRSADNVVDVRNDIQLQANRALWVFDNPDSAQDKARLSGAIANGDATGRQLLIYGNGLLELTGTNTLAGGLQLYGAETRVNGSVTSLTVVAAAAPGTFWPVLSGTGRVAGITANAGGIVSPGDGGVGTLAATGLVTFRKGSVYDWEVGPNQVSDLLAVEGGLTFDAGWTLRLRDGGGTAHAGDVLPLMTFTGNLASNTAWVLDASLLDPARWDASQVRVVYDPTNHLVALTGLQYLEREIAVSGATVTEGDAGTAEAVFTVTYTGVNADETEVAFQTVDGTAVSNLDYAASNGAVTVEYGSTAFIRIPVNGDVVREWPSETFHLQVAVPPGVRVRQERVTATITDDDAAFAFRMKIGFPGYTGADTLRDFPALVRLAEGAGGFSYGGLASPDGADLRFLDADFAQELPAEIDTWNRGGESFLWVKVPAIAGTNTHIWAVWGDPALTNAPAARTNGEVWSASFLGVYHLNELDGDRVPDSGPRGFHGSNILGRVSAGVIGQGADLMGANAISLTGLTSTEQSYTFECLARSADLVATKYILDIQTGRLSLGFNQAAVGQISLQNATWRQGGGAALNDGRWHPLVWVADRAANLASFYADGLLVATNTLAASFPNIGGEIRIGCVYNALGTGNYEGQLDEFRIAARARSSDWILAAYQTLNQNAAFTAYGEVQSAGGNPPAGEPLAIGNLPPGGVAEDRAVLNGIVLSAGGGSNPDVTVCWATNDCGTASTGAWTYAAALGAGRGAGESVSNSVTGLALGRAWYYRFYATNETGEAWGAPAERFTQPRGLYVALSGDGSDGLGWATAFTNIQAAFDAARPGDAVLLKGDRFDICSSSAGTNQLELTNGSVTVRGGYEGAGSPGSRDPSVWETIITRSAGTNRLIRIMNIDNVRFEGITLTNGYARTQLAGIPGHPDSSGGAVFIQNCRDVVLDTCTIMRNATFNPNANGYACYGGGVAVMTSRVSFVNCAVISNRCVAVDTSNRQNANGGGIGGLNNELTITDCEIIGNRVSGDRANELDLGGGVMVHGIGAIRRTVFRDNDVIKPTGDALTQGEGVYISGSALLENCLLSLNGQYTNTISGNANYAVYVAGGYATLRNCTIADHKQAGVYRAGGTVVLQNCLLWNNGNDIWENVVGVVQLYDTLTKDGDSDGVNGCFSLDPKFAETQFYHLQSTVGHYTGGAFSGGSWTTAAENSPGIDAGNPAHAYALEPYPNGGRINIGAYGGTEVASKSAPLAVENRAATAVTPSSAVLNGTVTAIGSGGTELFFGWGEADGGAVTQNWEHMTRVGTVDEPGETSLSVTGLAGNATYYFTLVAVNAGGGASAVAAPSLSFDTVLSAPVVANTGVENEAGPLVTLKGDVVSTGGEAPEVQVCWGSRPAGNDTSLWERAESLGPHAGAFQAVVSPASGGSYYYTCRAVNSAGESWASPPVAFGATNVFYVAAAAAGQGTGQGWANAFSNLQAALDACLPGKPSILYVKGGAAEPLEQALTLQVTLSDLAIGGGYEGTGWPGERDPARWPSILTHKSANAIRILRLQDVTNAVLDGLTVVRGTVADSGAGLYLANCSNVALRGCMIVSNVAINAAAPYTAGGGLFASNSYGLIESCRFERNTASHNGAGGSALGGGLFVTNGQWEIRHTILYYNKTRSSGVLGLARGAGAAFFGGQHRFINGLAIQNWPWGAAENTTYSQGGAFFLDGTAFQLENSTVSGNVFEGLRGANFAVIADSILWRNGDDLVGEPAYLGTSCVGNGDNAGTNGCFNADPLFEYGYYLGGASPCLGAGSRTAAAAGLDGRTTQAGGQADEDTVDLGWHAAAGITPAHNLYVDRAAGDDANSGTNAAEAVASVTRALALADIGARIHIAAGQYDRGTETFPLLVDKAGVQLLGAGAEVTVLTATGAFKRVMLVAEAPAVRISGLTVHGGYLAPYSGQVGAGLAVFRTAGTRIDGCRLTGNSTVGGADEYMKGGGLYTYLSSGRIEDSFMVSNLVHDSVDNYNGYAQGGGLMFEGGSWAAVRCVMKQNTCTGKGYQGAGGAGAATLGGTHLFQNCLVATNYVPFLTHGVGGHGLLLDSAAVVSNCTVADNYGPAGVAGNSSILQAGAGPVTVVNSIVTGNTNDLAGFTTNEVGQAVNVSYSFIGDGMNAGFQECLTGDPLFVDRIYYHLQSRGYPADGYFQGVTWVKGSDFSPLIDAGDPASGWSQEPLPNGKRVNLGAYGNTAAASKSPSATAAVVILY